MEPGCVAQSVRSGASASARANAGSERKRWKYGVEDRATRLGYATDRQPVVRGAEVTSAWARGGHHRQLEFGEQLHGAAWVHSRRAWLHKWTTLRPFPEQPVRQRRHVMQRRELGLGNHPDSWPVRLDTLGVRLGVARHTVGVETR